MPEQLAYRYNRMVLYSGHLFHSPSISRDALLRIQEARLVRVARQSLIHDWGLDLVDDRGEWARVHRLRPGPLAEWNKRCRPEERVAVGAYVLEVNGRRGASEELKQALRSSTVISMLVSRRRPDAFTTSGRLTLQNFVPDGNVAAYGRVFNELEGMEEALGRLQAGHSAVHVDPGTMHLLHELVAAEWLPAEVLGRVRHEQGRATVAASKVEHLVQHTEL